MELICPECRYTTDADETLTQIEIRADRVVVRFYCDVCNWDIVDAVPIHPITIIDWLLTHGDPSPDRDAWRLIPPTRCTNHECGWNVHTLDLGEPHWGWVVDRSGRSRWAPWELDIICPQCGRFCCPEWEHVPGYVDTNRMIATATIDLILALGPTVGQPSSG